MLKNVTYLKFKRFLCAKPEEVKLYMKLHEDKHCVTSISDVVNNIYVGSHKRNAEIMIVNSSNSLSRGESGERANVASSYLATIQNNSKYTKSNLNVIEMFCIWEKR